MNDGRSGEAVPPAPPTSKTVISRLSLYLRELQRFVREGKERTNSSELARALGLSDALVRRDLSSLGQLGKPGVGYRCDDSVARIKSILGTNRPWRVALVGVGNLGRALLGYRGFAEQGFRIGVAFDVASDKVGRTIGGVPVRPWDELEQAFAEAPIDLALLAVPAEAAQEAVRRLAAAGVRGALNFAPVSVVPVSGFPVVGVDLAIQLEQLAFAVANESPKD
ncbi:MAG TPA: redox-sensing transcriptional repressor Rex [Pirellulaceae bacterium]|jgi:redox-sensing transcriptional repressor|nr:redox-sensing transcriptional repressor Rex [Pirellulaceae bacterium]